MSLVSGSKQHQGVKRTSILHHVKDEHSCQPINVSCLGSYRYSSVRWEFILVAYYFQLSSSNLESTGFDWVVGRRDLQGFNIASTSSFCGLDILQLQFHHSVGIPVAQYVHTIWCHRCARPSWSTLSIWQVATSKKNMSTCMGPVKHYLQEYHFISRRRAVSAQKPTTRVSDSVWNCRVGWNKLIYN